MDSDRKSWECKHREKPNEPSFPETAEQKCFRHQKNSKAVHSENEGPSS